MLLQLVVLSLEDPSAPTDRHANICSRLHKPHIDGVEVFSRRVYQMGRWFPLLYQCHLQGVSYSSYLENGFSTIVSCHNPPPPPRSSLSPCLIGTGLLSQWRCVQIQLVCVMLCCLVLHSNGRSGQESSWTHTHTRVHTQTHTHGQEESLPRDSLFISLITILLVSE